MTLKDQDVAEADGGWFVLLPPAGKVGSILFFTEEVGGMDSTRDVFVGLALILLSVTLVMYASFSGPQSSRSQCKSRCTDDGVFEVLVTFPEGGKRWLMVDTNVCKRWENDNR